MNYVLDSCVGVKWHITEALSDKAKQLRDDWRKRLHQLCAPDLFPTEIAHALTRAERQGRITPAEGAQFLADTFLDLPVMHNSVPLLKRAYVISSQFRVGIYDCLYVALSESAKCDLLTADDKLIRILQPHFPFMIHLSSLP